MISRFGSLYIGHVDLVDIGFAGIPVDERRLSDEHLATVFAKAESIAVLMDRLGYDTLWLGEHHFQHEGHECIPNPLLLGVHLTHLTDRLKFGCAFNITPNWHPLRLAEDYATADILTNGRIVFGVGRGYHTREVETLGAPLIDQDANRELFEEQVEIIFKAFNKRSFSHRGRRFQIPPRVPYRGYQLEEITLVPRPRNLPVECYQPIVSASRRGMDFMARNGIRAMIGGGGAVADGAAEELIQDWRQSLARAGRQTEPGGDLIVNFYTHLAETEDRAKSEVRPFVEEYLKVFAPTGLIDLSEHQLAALAGGSGIDESGLTRVVDQILASAWLCGPPDLVADKLTAVQERYPGLEQINVGSVIGTPETVVLEQLRWFGEDVMPRFRAEREALPG
ncbi:MAG: LLM class flavin-dependent oxidoreductase [Chloroflexota bacterium]|nr:LLM class flavin-dependent oxidoreductase [Chloroflexota bacterium]